MHMDRDHRAQRDALGASNTPAWGESTEAQSAQQRAKLDQKIQTKFDIQTRGDIEQLSNFFGVSGAEIVRTAFRVYNWARLQVARGYDVGAFDRQEGRFVAYDVPYATPAVRLDGREHEEKT